MNDPERQLDDVERDLYERAAIVGDDHADRHASLLVVPLTLLPPAGRPSDGGARDAISLAGTWRMSGHRPVREFSIGHWTAPAGAKPDGRPPEWWREDTDRGDWLPATVPGSVQAALVAAGELPDPHWDATTYDELTAHGEPADWPWHFRRTRVEDQEWWLARRFTVPPRWRGRRLRLAFDGIDYAATVYVNGMPLRHHTGMFGGPEVEVTRLVRHDTENEVVVRIFPPPRDWHGVPKGSPGWGWHYGHLISMGIWRDVRLEAVPDVEVENLFVRTTGLERHRAELRIRFDLTNHTGETLDVELAGRIDPPDGGTESVHAFRAAAVARPGTVRYEAAVTIDDPALWWPAGYGDQPLYRLRIAGRDDGVGGAETEFGIRTVEMAALPDWSGPEHYRWQFVVNGRRLFVKGANWCWTDPLLSAEFDTNAHLLELARRANLQVLRAWGGGIVESDDFYRACDRLGLMVYQEFPLTFGVPDAPVTDLAVLDQQVSRVVQRLRNHPSLIMWGGGNENARSAGGDEAHLLMGRRCAQLDPSRPFHRTSPWGGSAHNYRVYHEGEPIDSGYRAVDAAFYGEYGLSSQSGRESMLRFLPARKLASWPPPPDGAILQHQAQFGLFDLVKQLRYANYGPVDGWDTMIEYSQLAQGDALRYASELARAGSGTHCGGFLFYKLTDLFPGASWSVVDFYGVPKLSYYRARQFCRPRSAFAVYERLEWSAGERFRAGVHVANDTPVPLESATVTAVVHDAALRPVHRQRATVSVPADGRVEAMAVDADLGAAAGRVFLLAVELRDDRGELVSDQWYWLNPYARTARLRELEALPLDELARLPVDEVLRAYAEPRPAPLLELPRTTLELEVAGGRSGHLLVRNTGAVSAVNILVDGFPSGLGDFLDDNSICLRPGEARALPFVLSSASADLSRLGVRAWNAPPARPTTRR
ncbi:glycoside hydrolase family 2 protein [Jiangella rhizosphaerae]|uniref:Beta-mannosidase B n=1 Tax=Jiangella rhizosphaerae TaxID=2293569 RepID=A0A418KKX1_9ACTN|nr:glycoside hydrolase family 2 TIM barrel-domain containing protein [Jiangella rhizosphaerae]RIQ17825.1 hypothetical protein DY240_22070 [Jiangella rhizosphaerae]